MIVRLHECWWEYGNNICLYIDWIVIITAITLEFVSDLGSMTCYALPASRFLGISMPGEATCKICTGVRELASVFDSPFALKSLQISTPPEFAGLLKPISGVRYTLTSGECSLRPCSRLCDGRGLNNFYMPRFSYREAELIERHIELWPRHMPANHRLRSRYNIWRWLTGAVTLDPRKKIDVTTFLIGLMGRASWQQCDEDST